VLIFKKGINFGIRKKNLEKGKGLKSLLNLSLSKEILKRIYHINSSTSRYIGCDVSSRFILSRAANCQYG
jgi:hypothetical protein